MRRLVLLLIPAALWGGSARYARLGESDGKVEVQLQASDGWAPALRNLPLLESSRVRTAAGSRLEIELDDGGVFRLGPDSLGEISDYTRLSTGQRITLLSLDDGVAYFTGLPEGRDSLSLAVPGAQITLRKGARIRLEVNADWSQVSVIEGGVRFSSPAAEFDLGEGQTARVEPERKSRFFLYREVAALPLDQWSEQRDQVQASASSGRYLPVGYGLADLDGAGEWVQTDDLGAVWKPKLQDGWAPYRNGRWHWYDTLGYTWISGDSWGWLPYHYGRWTRRQQLGWVWAPSKSAVFKPGDVWWLRGQKIAGWGPLAPGEEWTPGAPPLQFLNANITWANWQADARVIDPTGFDARPKEPLGVAAFTIALPSPPFLASRLEAGRPALRAAGRPVTPVISGVTYSPENEVATAPPPPPPANEPPAVVTNPGTNDAPVVVYGGQAPPPPPPPQDVIYPVPVYTGIIVVNPPENRPPRGDKPPVAPSQPARAPRAEAPPASAPAPRPLPRIEPSRDSHDRNVSVPAPRIEPPVVRPSSRVEPSRGGQDRVQPPAAPAPAPAPAERPASDKPASRRGTDDNSRKNQ
jgi:hypothetical protein